MCVYKKCLHPVLLFSKIKIKIFGCFDPENIFLDNESKYFQGDLTDISAKKEALPTPHLSHWLGTIHIQTVVLQRSMEAKPTERKANTRNVTPSQHRKECNNPNSSETEETEAQQEQRGTEK